MNSLVLHSRSNRRKGAFTLIEILVVMVIIAILATILVPKVIGHLAQAKVTKAQADLTTLKGALNTFYIDNGQFPSSSDGLGALVHNPGDLPKWEKTLDTDSVPTDPWGRPYVYRFPSNTPGDDFDLLCTGPSGQEGNPDNIKPQ